MNYALPQHQQATTTVLSM